MPIDPPPPVLTRNIGGNSLIVGPVLQFSLFIVPIVMNCFYMVYALAGWVVEGRDKLTWSLEAPTVGFWVCASMVAYSLLVLGFVRWRGANWWHPLSVSSIAHIIVVLALTASILITIKL